MDTITQLENVTLKVRDACRYAEGVTGGSCREASIVLAEAIVGVAGAQGASVCHGTFDDHAHFWVRTHAGGQSWILDATVEQFERDAPVVQLESDATSYHEKQYIYFSPAKLQRLRSALAVA